MAMFQEVFGEAHKGNSEVRWYCKFEIAEQVKNGFPLLTKWIDRCLMENVAAASIQGLQDLLTSHETTIKLELAAQSDALKPFVQVCYHLEGDESTLVFDVYENYQSLLRHIDVCRGRGALDPAAISLPQTYAVEDGLSPPLSSARKPQQCCSLYRSRSRRWNQRSSISRSLLYHQGHRALTLQEMLSGPLCGQVDMYNAARMFHLTIMFQQGWNADTIQQNSQHIPFLRTSPLVIAGMCAELPKYKKLITEQELARDGDVEKWWCKVELKVPNWFFGATNMMLHQPSSASVEHVFSMLKAIMTDNQQHALEDYQRTAIMCRYNQLMRRNE